MPELSRAARAARHPAATARAIAHRLSNRRFAPSLAAEDGAPVLVLSPHLDDAALSCWSVLSSADDVRVVNAFAAVPASPSPQRWDLECGASDARAHVEERIAEDRRALALAGRRPINLPFVDWQYRQQEMPPSYAALDRALTACLSSASLVYAPATLGHDHPDHILLRSLAFQLLGAGLPVRLYADLPYCAEHGWPPWVSGREVERGIDVDARWRPQIGRMEEAVELGPPDVRRLTPEAADRKLQALRSYATQFSALDRAFPGVLTDREVYGYEVFWSPRRPPRDYPRRASWYGAYAGAA